MHKEDSSNSEENYQKFVTQLWNEYIRKFAHKIHPYIVEFLEKIAEFVKKNKEFDYRDKYYFLQVLSGYFFSFTVFFAVNFLEYDEVEARNDLFSKVIECTKNLTSLGIWKIIGKRPQTSSDTRDTDTS